MLLVKANEICTLEQIQLVLVLCFQVDSVEFPGQKHRWLLTQILIKGNEKSRLTMLNNLANCLYLIGIEKLV